QKSSRNRRLLASAADELTHHFGGVIHHRNNPRIIEPRRADDAQHADDAAGAVAIGRNDGRGARKRKQLVLRADEDTCAFGALGTAEKIDHTALRFESVKEKP